MTGRDRSPRRARILRLEALLLAAGVGLAAAIARPDARAQDSPSPPAAPEAAPAPAPAPEVAPDPEAAAPARGYEDLRRITPISGDAQAGQAKSELCAACHGPQGIAIAPNFSNLAGQRADYLYRELVDYRRGSRPESAMTPLVADLDDQDMRDLAAYYAALVPTAVPAAPADEATPAPDAALLQLGEKLYLAGDPAKGIPPCQGCHGGDARGHPDALRADSSGHTPYAVYPALRGQQALYLQTRLGELRDGKLHHSTTDFVMRGVAERLDDDSIQALSAWLSSQPQ